MHRFILAGAQGLVGTYPLDWVRADWFIACSDGQGGTNSKGTFDWISEVPGVARRALIVFCGGQKLDSSYTPGTGFPEAWLLATISSPASVLPRPLLHHVAGARKVKPGTPADVNPLGSDELAGV